MNPPSMMREIINGPVAKRKILARGLNLISARLLPMVFGVLGPIPSLCLAPFYLQYVPVEKKADKLAFPPK